MSERDFRYELPNGTVVEAFQMHEGSRYQEALWPDWMDSKMLMTKQSADGGNTHWLNINDVETEIPQFGWIIKHPSGTIGVLDYASMESATKVVRDVPKVPAVLKPQSDDALRLAAKITKQSFDDVKALDLQQVEAANRERQRIIDSMHPDDAAAQGLRQSQTMAEVYKEVAESMEPEPVLELGRGEKFSTLEDEDNGLYEVTSVALPNAQLLEEMRDVYRHWQDGDLEVAGRLLKTSLASRTNWCSCAPGLCDGNRDTWECRQNSLLAK